MEEVVIYHGKDLEWILSTDFGVQVFVMVFLTWGLVIVNLFLLMIYLVHKLAKSLKLRTGRLKK